MAMGRFFIDLNNHSFHWWDMPGLCWLIVLFVGLWQTAHGFGLCRRVSERQEIGSVQESDDTEQSETLSLSEESTPRISPLESINVNGVMVGTSGTAPSESRMRRWLSNFLTARRRG